MVRAFATVCVCGRTPELKQKPQRKKTSPQSPVQRGCPLLRNNAVSGDSDCWLCHYGESPVLAGSRLVTLERSGAHVLLKSLTLYIACLCAQTCMYLQCSVRSQASLFLFATVQRAPAGERLFIKPVNAVKEYCIVAAA